MKQLGIPEKELVEIGIVTNLDKNSQLIDKLLADKDNIEENLKNGSFTTAKKEAIIHTVASMIAKNNEFLQKQLESFGFLENP